MSERLDIVDIHTHVWPPAWGPGGVREKPSGAFSAEIHRKINSPAALVGELDTDDIDLAIVSATIESLFGAEGPIDLDAVREANGWLATLSELSPKLAGLAVTDAFAGEKGAEIAEAALNQPGIVGLVLDSARDGRFIGDPSTRPVLELAARRKVPVFVHPVAHPDAEVLIAGAGMLGNSLGRGLMNGVAFLSILQKNILKELPDLHLVFATLGLGAIVQAARGGVYGREERHNEPRPNVYFDTMGDDPAIIRLLTGFFGAERVVAGTDWPILPGLQRERLGRNLADAGLSAEEAALVAGGNARRLLGLR